MAIADNSVVSVEYDLVEVGKTDIIDSNRGHQPLEFIMGKGQIIPGLEKEIAKLNKGDDAKIEVDSANAYGAVNPEAVETLSKAQFAGIDLEKGMQLFGQGENGETVAVTVKDFDDDSVTVDYNHPLAGKDLEFNVSILDVRDATPDEIATGIVGGGHCHDGSCGCGS